jgi:hypothetical protein
MRTVGMLILLLCFPISTSAQQVSFLIEEAHASSEIEVEDPSGYTGRQAREYRERIQQQYEEEASSSSSEAVIEETVTTGPVEVQIPTNPTFSSEFSDASSSAPEEPYYEPTPKSETYIPSLPAVDQEEQDKLTLEQLEEYANEASTNAEEQIEQLEDGFSITSTSSLGSPLPTTQRSAILRRNVRTVAQLKLFARALAESDANIRKIVVEDNTVTVSYRKKAWVFGFVPFNFILETTVVENEVVVEKPWWLLFSRDDVDDHIAVLEAELTELEEEEEGIQGLLKRMQKMMQAMSSESQS